MSLTRRRVIKAAGLSAACSAMRPFISFAAGPQASDDKQFHGLRVGVCSLSLKDVHLPLTSTSDQRKQVRMQAEDLGLSITSCGVIYLKDTEAEMRQAFDYVHDLGASLAVVGVFPQQLRTLDKVIRSYDLKAAIHNHAPKDNRFPSPLEIYDA